MLEQLAKEKKKLEQLPTWTNIDKKHNSRPSPAQVNTNCKNDGPNFPSFRLYIDHLMY